MTYRKTVKLRETMKMMLNSRESERRLENRIPNPLEVVIKKTSYILDKRIEIEKDPLVGGRLIAINMVFFHL